MTDTARRWLIGIVAAVLVVLFLWWSADYVYDLGRADARAECREFMADSLDQLFGDQTP